MTDFNTIAHIRDYERLAYAVTKVGQQRGFHLGNVYSHQQAPISSASDTFMAMDMTLDIDRHLVKDPVFKEEANRMAHSMVISHREDEHDS
jgi:hypothetical protein